MNYVRVISRKVSTFKTRKLVTFTLPENVCCIVLRQVVNSRVSLITCFKFDFFCQILSKLIGIFVYFLQILVLNSKVAFLSRLFSHKYQ